MEGKTCPVCGQGKLSKQVGPQEFEFQGQTLTVQGYVSFPCDHCGEAVIRPDDNAEADEQLAAWQRRLKGE